MLFLLALGVSAHATEIAHGICGQLEGLGFSLIIVMYLWTGGLEHGSENGLAVSAPDFCVGLAFIKTCLALISDLYVVLFYHAPIGFLNPGPHINGEL